MNDYLKKLKELSQTPEFYKGVSVIGDKYSLMLDTQDELTAEIQDVIRGHKASKDLIDNIKNRLEIDRELASQIANDVNIDILEPIKSSIQKIKSGADIEPTPPQPPKPVFNRNPVINTNPVVSNPQTQPAAPVQMPVTQKPIETIGSTPLEKAGRFTLENPPIGVPNYTQVPISKKEALKGIEDLEANMVDHLLSSPVKNTENVEVKKPLIPKPVIDNQPYKADPYREQI